MKVSLDKKKHLKSISTVVLVLTSYSSALNMMSVLKAAEIMSLANRLRVILAKRNHLVSADALSSGRRATFFS